MSPLPEPVRKDLVALVADKNIEAVMTGLLTRTQALGIRPITFDIFVHPRRDPGCLAGAHDFLRPLGHAYHHALVLFDHEGCGREQIAPSVLADEVKEHVEAAGWAGRADAIVLAPELEVWVWSDSPHVPRCLGWADREPPLREWLAQCEHWPPGKIKPDQPKVALEAALRDVRKPRSSAIYGELARSVSLRGHTEPAFLRLVQVLQGWFSE